MSFQLEPRHSHGARERTAVLLINLGTPEAPTASALRRYLAEFLWDRRVVEIPRPLWWLILHGVILRTRPARSAAKYASIWRQEGSPLLYWTQRVAQRLTGQLGESSGGLGGQRGGNSPLVRHAMRYGQPSIASVLDQLKSEGVTRILVLPLYPQYSATTVASAVDAVNAWAQNIRRLPELRFVMRYHDHAGYIVALAASVRRHWQKEGRAGKLVMSFHGIPARNLALGDPYHCECHVTARLLAEQLGLGRDDWVLSFQSRFGRAEWLQPYTEPTVRRLAAEGVRRVDVICPGFAVDCLETLEEIGQELRASFLAAGGETFHRIPCLNDDDAWIAALAGLVERHLSGWPQDSESPDQVAQRARSRERAVALGASN